MKKFPQKLLFLIAALFFCCPGCAETPPEPSESPEHVLLRVDDGAFTITDAGGDTLTHEGSFSGSIPVTGETHLDELPGDRGEYHLEVPYSERFTYESLGGGEQSFEVFFRREPDTVEYSVSGTGIETASIDLSGKVSLNGSGMAFTVFLSMPCTGLGPSGCIRFHGSAEQEASFQVEGDTVRFSGVTPGSVSISYAGDQDISESFVDLGLKKGNGTIDLSGAAEGRVLVKTSWFGAKQISTE